MFRGPSQSTMLLSPRAKTAKTGNAKFMSLLYCLAMLMQDLWHDRCHLGVYAVCCTVLYASPAVYQRA
jgi:hypothetical protein